jgi:hypothetical protein
MPVALVGLASVGGLVRLTTPKTAVQLLLSILTEQTIPPIGERFVQCGMR